MGTSSRVAPPRLKVDLGFSISQPYMAKSLKRKLKNKGIKSPNLLDLIKVQIDAKTFKYLTIEKYNSLNDSTRQ